MTTLLSIDWLTVNYCGAFENNPVFEFRKLPYGTRQFAEIYEVYYYGEECGSLVRGCNLPSIPSDFMQFKLSNWTLYCDYWQMILRDVVQIFGWRYHSISRLDVCLDFHRFRNGLDPHDFIRRFLGGKYSLVSKSKFHVIGSADGRNSYEYLGVGSKSSAVKLYLYNKTKELAEETYKKWIVDSWKLAGIDPDKDVWRLEVSLSSDAMLFCDVESGEEIPIDLDFVSSYERVAKLFCTLAAKHFRFIPYSESKNRYRKRPLELLDLECVCWRRLDKPVTYKYNRSDKIFAAKLVAETQKKQFLCREDRFALVTWELRWLADRDLLKYVEKRGLKLTL